MVKPSLALGTAQFGMHYGVSNQQGQLTQASIVQILDKALAGGVQVIDTAQAYGNAEERLGAYASLDKFKVVTKLKPGVEEGDDESVYAQVMQELHRSLGKLGISSLYGFLLHRPDALFDKPIVWRALRAAQEAGLVKKIGFSVYSPDQCQKLIDSGFVPDLIQAPYSLFDQRFAPAFEIYSKQNIEIHVRSVFLQGAPFLSSLQRQRLWGYDPAAFDALSQFCARNSVPVSKFLLAYALSAPNISAVVVGVDGVANFDENVNVVASMLTDLGFGSDEALQYAINDERVLLPIHWQQQNLS
jgi:aryl-alcohol dehydrogenase-like predicted oxidoreductase